jgi:hypothetical protein
MNLTFWIVTLMLSKSPLSILEDASALLPLMSSAVTSIERVR